MELYVVRAKERSTEPAASENGVFVSGRCSMSFGPLTISLQVKASYCTQQEDLPEFLVQSVMWNKL